jgi:hypothetical protein
LKIFSYEWRASSTDSFGETANSRANSNTLPSNPAIHLSGHKTKQTSVTSHFRFDGLERSQYFDHLLLGGLFAFDWFLDIDPFVAVLFVTVAVVAAV